MRERKEKGRRGEGQKEKEEREREKGSVPGSFSQILALLTARSELMLGFSAKQ